MKQQLTLKNVILVLSLVLNALQNLGTVPTAAAPIPVAAPTPAPCAE